MAWTLQPWFALDVHISVALNDDGQAAAQRLFGWPVSDTQSLPPDVHASSSAKLASGDADAARWASSSASLSAPPTDARVCPDLRLDVAQHSGGVVLTTDRMVLWAAVTAVGGAAVGGGCATPHTELWWCLSAVHGSVPWSLNHWYVRRVATSYRARAVALVVEPPAHR
jgi:hypothetical protein